MDTLPLDLLLLLLGRLKDLGPIFSLNKRYYSLLSQEGNRINAHLYSSWMQDGEKAHYKLGYSMRHRMRITPHRLDIIKAILIKYPKAKKYFSYCICKQHLEVYISIFPKILEDYEYHISKADNYPFLRLIGEMVYPLPMKMVDLIVRRLARDGVLDLLDFYLRKYTVSSQQAETLVLNDYITYVDAYPILKLYGMTLDRLEALDDDSFELICMQLSGDFSYYCALKGKTRAMKELVIREIYASLDSKDILTPLAAIGYSSLSCHIKRTAYIKTWVNLSGKRRTPHSYWTMAFGTRSSSKHRPIVTRYAMHIKDKIATQYFHFDSPQIIEGLAAFFRAHPTDREQLIRIYDYEKQQDVEI